jgi:hypothetical protein
VPLDHVDAQVDKLCDELKLCAPVARGYTKLAMNKVWETDHQSGLYFEVEAWGMVNSQGEFNADVFDDFLNGRQPVSKNTNKLRPIGLDRRLTINGRVDHEMGPYLYFAGFAVGDREMKAEAGLFGALAVITISGVI